MLRHLHFDNRGEKPTEVGQEELELKDCQKPDVEDGEDSKNSKEAWEVRVCVVKEGRRRKCRRSKRGGLLRHTVSFQVAAGLLP